MLLWCFAFAFRVAVVALRIACVRFVTFASVVGGARQKGSRAYAHTGDCGECLENVIRVSVWRGPRN